MEESLTKRAMNSLISEAELAEKLFLMNGYVDKTHTISLVDIIEVVKMAFSEVKINEASMIGDEIYFSRRKIDEVVKFILMREGFYKIAELYVIDSFIRNTWLNV